MKLTALLITLMMYSLAAYADIYQCDNGEFRDTPCPNGKSTNLSPTAVEKSIKEPTEAPIERPTPVTPTSEESLTSNSLSENIKYEEEYDKFSKTIAKIDSIYADGNKCRAIMTVQKKSSICDHYLEYMRPFGEYETALKSIENLSKNTKFYTENQAKFELIEFNKKDIIDINNYISERSHQNQ